MQRKNVSSGAKWETIIGYSRAVRVGNVVEVAGTSAVDGDKVIGKGDVYEQAKFIFKKIENTLTLAGVRMKDVVRTRLYVVDITQWEDVGRAHAEVFADINPVATMVQVSRLIDPDLLIEIEVTAVVAD